MRRLSWIALIVACATPVVGQPKPKATVQNIVFDATTVSDPRDAASERCAAWASRTTPRTLTSKRRSKSSSVESSIGSPARLSCVWSPAPHRVP